MWSLDRIAIAVCIAGALVRIGNLMNSEIYGEATSLPWGFVFVRAGETVPMHPTQIYEALAYLILFVVLCWMYYRKDVARKRPGVMFGIFLIALFGFRFFVEFIKNPRKSSNVACCWYGTVVERPVRDSGRRHPVPGA